MSKYYRIYPVIAGILVGLLYLGWTTMLAGKTTASESRLLVRPTNELQNVYAGQLDRFIANEIGVLLSTDSINAVAKTSGIGAPAITAATTAVQTPGSDVIVVRVKNLATATQDNSVNQLLVQNYTASVTARVNQVVAQPLKDLNTQMATLKTQMDALSARIATITSAAQKRTPNIVVAPETAAPVETSQRSLLLAQYTRLQDQATSLQNELQDAGSGVDIVAEPTTIKLSKPMSLFALVAAILGGAALGLVLALVHVRLRPTVQSWEEVERALAGRRWFALDSRVPLGVQMPNPALNSLAMWLGDEGRRANRVHIEIADLPGQGRVAALVRQAAEKAAETHSGSEFQMRTIREGAAAGNAAGIIVPYKAGTLNKQQLQSFVQNVRPETTLFVIEA